jgi:virulence factor
MRKLGIVSLESSHVDRFCEVLNLADDEAHIAGARVVAVCPQDNEPARVAEVCRRFGIETVVDSPEALVPLVDAGLVLGRDGARHCVQALPFLRAGKPCFVDKPFTHSVEDAALMVETARASGAPIMSASAVRFAVELDTHQEEIEALGELKHCSLTGPGELFFYGIHLVDLLMRLAGPGVEVVSDLREEGADLIVVSYGDGRTATLQLLRGPSVEFGVHLIGATGELSFAIRDPAYYARTARAILEMIETGRQAVPAIEMVEAVRVLVAADRSAEQGGRPVRLAEVFPYRRPF